MITFSAYIQYYQVLLCTMLILISACDSSDEKYYTYNDNKAIKISKFNNTYNSTIISQFNLQEKFTKEKQKSIQNLIIENHYKKLNLNDINKYTENALQLNQYLQQLDPYSKYISANQYKLIKSRNKLKRVGVGFNLLVYNNEILIVPIINTPLYHAGLKKPHYLSYINQHKINYKNFNSYAFLNKIQSGDRLNITVKKNNLNTEENYSVIAKQYQRKLITYQEIQNIAIIRIDEFGEGVQKKLLQFLKQIDNKKTLIIDLRYSPGGDLFAAVDMLSPFLGANKKVAYLKNERSYRPISLKSIKGQRLFKQPIYLLSSKFTASSAEVFIRAIKHSVKNSYLIGMPTQGKCFAQESYVLKDQSALLLSSYNILDSNQKNCDQNPIVPDQYIPNIELLEIEQLLERFIQNEHISVLTKHYDSFN